MQVRGQPVEDHLNHPPGLPLAVVPDSRISEYPFLTPMPLPDEAAV
jgi:hypothetical protein